MNLDESWPRRDFRRAQHGAKAKIESTFERERLHLVHVQNKLMCSLFQWTLLALSTFCNPIVLATNANIYNLNFEAFWFLGH